MVILALSVLGLWLSLFYPRWRLFGDYSGNAPQKQSYLFRVSKWRVKTTAPDWDSLYATLYKETGRDEQALSEWEWITDISNSEWYHFTGGRFFIEWMGQRLEGRWLIEIYVNSSWQMRIEKWTLGSFWEG